MGVSLTVNLGDVVVSMKELSHVDYKALHHKHLKTETISPCDIFSHASLILSFQFDWIFMQFLLVTKTNTHAYDNVKSCITLPLR